MEENGGAAGEPEEEVAPTVPIPMEAAPIPIPVPKPTPLSLPLKSNVRVVSDSVIENMKRYYPILRKDFDGELPANLKWPADCLKRFILDPNPANLRAELMTVWRGVVPEFYSLQENQDCLVPFKNKKDVEDHLIEPLTLILTGGYGTDTMFDFLKATDPPATICGKVFQTGEATYCCRDCGLDPTCVLCADCFKASQHRHHRYKIAASGGGGYCDCGDGEAWKSFVHCENHLPKEGEEAKAKMPEGQEDTYVARVMGICKAIIAYAYRLTTQMESGTSLPDYLTPPPGTEIVLEGCNERFCTVLFNDETHTFDIVIQTLSRALGCNKKDAIDYATTIDREGRSIVRVAKFSPCSQVSSLIERQTSRNGGKPLKVVVMHSLVVAHQAFALRLLGWLEMICSKNETIRKCVAQILTSVDDLNPGAKSSFKYTWCEGILFNDTTLWKSARTCWHRLLISSLLKDYEYKKFFAEVFTKHYADLMKDFILDDHDHSFSITSLSVQIFTVPSLAHYLVEEQDVLFTIMRTLLSECEQRLNSKKKLEFNRESLVNNLFKRANYAIIDLKYILSSIPTKWSEKMFKNVSHAIESFLKLLSFMQEMDAVTRQVGQHMEYEPEWESAFNLHIKLQPVMQLSLEWCGANKQVFIRAYRRCLSDLSQAYSDLKDNTVTLELANHSATCYVYDVASQPVSVHLPLTRYFAGLYLYLEKFELEFDSHNLNLTLCDKPPPAMIMEPTLRTQVLIAQVNSQMWKRNGYALLNQLYFYHNVRCRTDMLDKDIITLQIGASLIESNEFLLHLINRFGLQSWTDTNYEDKALKPQGPEEDLSKYLPSLADELFGLIITIISARYIVGVGEVTKNDCVKKEVIQQLCIEPMTHSTLNKALVENVNFETGLEQVIKDVAVLKGPTAQRTSVVYELRPEFYDSYDVYHYHYSREDMSKAEEKQRERKRAAKDPEFFPPPKLPPFTSQFNMVVNILQSDVLLHLISLVLARSIPKTGRLSGSSESIIRKVLHLIGHGLNEEIARNEKEGENFFQFSDAAKRWKIFEYLDELLREANSVQYHDMILWIKRRLNRLRPQEENLSDQNEPIIVQQNEEEEKKRKAELMKEAKEKMMATMAAAQQKFMAVNKELFVDADLGVEPGKLDHVQRASSETIAIGPKKTKIFTPEERFVCILCQEEQVLAVGSKRFVLASFIQRSTVMCEYRDKLIEEANKDPEENSIPHLEQRNPLYLDADLMSAPVVSTCGHIMHESCWSSHFETVFNKERRRPYRLRHPISFDVMMNEWLCPMCDCICNAALPMSPPLAKLYTIDKRMIPHPERRTQPASFDTWIQGMQLVLKSKTVSQESIMSTTENYQKFINDETVPENPIRYLRCMELDKVKEQLGEPGAGFATLYPKRMVDVGSPANKWLSAGVMNRLSNFMSLNYTTGLEVDVNENDFRVPLMMWQALAFTILSSEAYHRDQMIPFFGEDVPIRKAIGLKYLIRASALACDRQGWQNNLRTFALKILTNLLHNPGNSASLVECDAFGLLVTLTFSMPALFGGEGPPVRLENKDDPPIDGRQDPNEPSSTTLNPPNGSPGDHHILRLIFMYHITQILVSNDFSDCIHSEPKETEIVTAGLEDIDTRGSLEEDVLISTTSSSFVSRKACIFGEVWRIAKKDSLPWNEMKRIDCDAVWKKICEASLPFLRCCAKLYENLTGIVPPPALENVKCSFERLLKYLDLPNSFEELFDSPFCWQIPYKWASHPSVSKILNTTLPADSRDYPKLNDEGKITDLLPGQIPVQYPRRLGNLITLPDDYTELINMVSNFTCKNCTSLDSRVPTMCMICGEILCSQSYLTPYGLLQSYCCQKELKQNPVGPCIYHANFCGGGYGVFLRIRECKLFFTGGKNRGCFLLPPYLDEYGETDQGLRRGNPLSLSKEKYEIFRKIWLQCAIPEEIARITEHSTSIVATEWQFL